RLLAYPPKQHVARDLPAVEIGARQQGVVVEHLLEVGDEPARVHRIAREAGGNLGAPPTPPCTASYWSRSVRTASSSRRGSIGCFEGLSTAAPRRWLT